MRHVAIATLCALAACAGDDGGSMTQPDAAITGDTTSCTRPALAAPWLQSYLTSTVTSLAAAPRSTTSQRTTARNFFQSQLTQLGWTPQLHTYASGANVYATIPATNGDTKQIVVGAHFDTVPNSPGANDNASGSAAVLALARYLTEMPCRAHPVTVVFLDEEEVGLVGARAFARMLPPQGVLAVHTVDQIAWDNDNDKRFELELPAASLEADYRAAATVVGALVSVTSTQGTDHEAFRDEGFTAIGLTEEYVGGDTSPHRHTSQDTAATVDTPYLVLGTQLVAQAVMAKL